MHNSNGLSFPFVDCPKSTGLLSKANERMTQFSHARTRSHNRVLCVSCAKESAFGNGPKERALS